MPPRLGCPTSAPQRTGGWDRGQADTVRPAARPAFRRVRRLTPLVCWACVCCGSMGIPPLKKTRSPSLLLSLQPHRRYAAAIVKGDVRAIVLDIQRPGGGDHHDIRLHVVLLL